MKIIFTKRAYNSIVYEAVEKAGYETGGIFLGCHENGIWYVMENIGPGPEAVFTKSAFEYDHEFVERMINKKAALYKHEMNLIGLWHSHPESFNEFSVVDNEINSEYSKLSEDGAISIIVNIAATEVLFDPSSLAPGEQPQNPNFASKYLDSWRFVLSVNL